MTKSKRFVMKDPNDWGYPITDTDTGKVYSCASNIWMKELCTDINKIVDENEQLKKELESFKPIIFESDGKPVTLYKKGDFE